jgi:methionyl-tRNA synthetase
VKGAIDGMRVSFDEGGMLSQGIAIVRAVDQYINTTAPFKLAKTVEANPAAKAELGAILYNCAEALRLASLLLSPALITKIPEFWKAWGCGPAAGVPLTELAAFGGKHALQPGQSVGKGEILYMRADVKDAPPA